MPAPGAAIDGEISAYDLDLHTSRLDSAKTSEVLESIQFFRKKLSGKEPRRQLMVDSNLLPDFLRLLTSHPDKDIQFEAAWCLTNVAAGDSEMARAVVDVGALPVLSSLISLESAVSKVKTEYQLCSQCVWAVGNISEDSAAMRDLVIAAGIPTQMTAILKQAEKDGDLHGGVSPAMLEAAVWCSAKLFKGEPKFDDVLKALLEALMSLIQVKKHEALAGILWGLSFACEFGSEFASAVARGVDLKILVDLAKGHADHMIQTPALRILCDLVFCEEHITQAVIDAGGVECFFEIGLTKGGIEKRLVKDALRSLSNVAAGTTEQTMMIVLHPLMQELCARIPELPIDCQKEGLWVVTNSLHAKDTQIADLSVGPAPLWGPDDPVSALLQAIVAAGGLQVLIGGLKVAGNPLSKRLALEGLECMLAARDDDDPAGNPPAAALEEAGGLGVLEALQHDESHDVRRRARGILVKHFAAEDAAGGGASVAHINEAVDAIELDDD